jgi:hypothetical protein
MPAMSATPRLVQRLGLVLAAAGLVAGAAVLVTARSAPEADAVARQREMRDLARLGGMATVQTVKFDQWLGSIWHGQALGWTLAALGLLAGGACWWVGGLMGEEDE